MSKYFIKTYGCQMNFADSEKIAGWYEARGYQRAEKPEGADEVVIVTCSVRQTAEDRVYGLINNLSRLKVQSAKCKVAVKSSKLSRPKIILTGCLMRYPLKYLKDRLPDVNEFRRVSEYENSQFDNLIIRSSQTQAFVKIMEGCNNFCSYCVVPSARGREISRSMEEVVCEAEELAKRGYKEVILLGQNVNSYGNDIKNFKTKYKKPFAVLLEVLNKIPKMEKISFLTSNPWDLDDEIIKAMALPKIDRYLHLPVQSGDDEILRKMNRKYTVKDYVKLVEKIRKRIPDIKIGTDIIVGFPGETEEQFQNTVDLCKKVGFMKAYVAMYSPRLQTAAFKLEDNIIYKEKKRRWEVLNNLINRKETL